jgi:MYXO-CTERM domain-containing protein
VKTSWLLCLLAAPAMAGYATVQGDIVIVNDPTGGQFDLTQHPTGLGPNICAYAANGLYTQKDDDYDAIAVFTTQQISGLTSFLATTPQGNLVRQTDQGVAYGSFFFLQQPSAYGSAATLKHCAYMGPVSQYPMNPDDEFQVQASPFGGEQATGVSSIGVLGHEFGHHWLVWAAYDLGDGNGPQGLFRGDTRQDMDRPSAATGNLHWSAYADTQSVMYGNSITDNMDGTFTLSSGPHKYGPFDQYLMGLRAPSEVPPMLVVDDGSGRGWADFPESAGHTASVTGTAVRVGVDDVIRADGPRVPAYPNAQHCWRFAFIIVTGPGQTVTQQQLALVDAYRQRWETWFAWATDSRGSVDTRLDAIDACPATPPAMDAGQIVPPPVDAGAPQTDAGPPPMESPDAGPTGEMLPPEMAPMTMKDDPISQLKPGCGCTASPVDSLAMIALLSLAAWLGVRRQHH